MALRDRHDCETNNLPRDYTHGDKVSASQLNKLVNSVLRLITGDGKTIAVSYTGGKAVVSSLQKQIIPRMKAAASRFFSIAGTDEHPGITSPGSYLSVPSGSIVVFDGTPHAGADTDPTDIAAGSYGVWIRLSTDNMSANRINVIGTQPDVLQRSSLPYGCVNIPMVVNASSIEEMDSLDVPVGTFCFTIAVDEGTTPPYAMYVKVHEPAFTHALSGGWMRVKLIDYPYIDS